MESDDLRAALNRHWAASDANDFEAEHDIYREDAVLDYPQSGERIRGRRNIQLSRAAWGYCGLILHDLPPQVVEVNGIGPEKHVDEGEREDFSEEDAGQRRPS